MIPYGRHFVDEDDVESVVAALRSDWLTTGPRVEDFEDAIRSVVGPATEAVSVTSGTAALHTAYAAADVGPGDEVITSPLTFVATAAAAMARGATVRFADVERSTGNIDPASVAALLNSRTKVVAAVDYAGVPADLVALRSVLPEGVRVIEDAAHSFGSVRNGTPVGLEADLTCFSFFATKNITTAEGGAVVTTNALLAARARSFRNHGLVRDPTRMKSPDEGPWHQEVHELGLNYRLSDVLAALGTTQVAKLQHFKQRRAEIVGRYQSAFAGLPDLTLPSWRQDDDPLWHLYPLRVPADRRRSVFEDLRSQGIGVQVNYMPVYWHPVFTELGYQRGLCPNAEAYYSQEISLPLHPSLSDLDVQAVIDATLQAIQ